MVSSVPDSCVNTMRFVNILYLLAPEELSSVFNAGRLIGASIKSVGDVADEKEALGAMLSLVLSHSS